MNSARDWKRDLRRCLAPGFALLSVAVSPADAQTVSQSTAQPVVVRRGAVRDVPKEADIRKEVESSTRFDQAMGSKARPLKEERPQVDNSLLEHSLLLFDGEKFTIVPEGSILQMPAALRSRLIDKPAGDFVFWPTFLKRNVAWLTAKEVPLKMSRGDAKLAKGVLKEVANDPRVVVAVYRGGPIMVLEPAPEEAEPGAGSDTSKVSGQNSRQRKQP